MTAVFPDIFRSRRRGLLRDRKTSGSVRTKETCVFDIVADKFYENVFEYCRRRSFVTGRVAVNFTGCVSQQCLRQWTWLSRLPILIFFVSIGNVFFFHQFDDQQDQLKICPSHTNVGHFWNYNRTCQKYILNLPKRILHVEDQPSNYYLCIFSLAKRLGWTQIFFFYAKHLIARYGSDADYCVAIADFTNFFKKSTSTYCTLHCQRVRKHFFDLQCSICQNGNFFIIIWNTTFCRRISWFV